MKINWTFYATVLAATAAAPLAAQAPAANAAASIAAGTMVYDTSGNEVGKITEVAGGLAVVSTGSHEVRLPLTSFGTSNKGPVLAMTRAQLDAAAIEAAAAAAAALKGRIVPGAAVNGIGGTNVGTVKEVGDQFVVLATSHGDVRLPRTAFGAGTSGLFISMSAAELESAIAASRPKMNNLLEFAPVRGSGQLASADTC